MAATREDHSTDSFNRTFMELKFAMANKEGFTVRF